MFTFSVLSFYDLQLLIQTSNFYRKYFFCLNLLIYPVSKIKIMVPAVPVIPDTL